MKIDAITGNQMANPKAKAAAVLPADQRASHGPTLVGRPSSVTAQQLSTTQAGQTQASYQQRHSLLALWHLLSLDAPTVAALWTIFIARCAGLWLPWTAPAAMFLAVWMLYAGDRLLDARPQHDGREPAELEERHRFHHRHRRSFLGALVVAALALAALLHRLDPHALRLYATLGVLLAAWLLLVHAPGPATESHRLPKELAVGIFFAASVFIPTVASVPGLRPELLPTAILFAALCTLNCLCVYAWEHPGPRPLAHWTTRWATRHLPQLAATVILAAGSIAVFAVLKDSAAAVRLTALPALTCAASAALLFLLHLRRYRLPAVQLRAAADLVLLTPLAILPFLLAAPR